VVGTVPGGLYYRYWRAFQLVVSRLVKRKQQGGCLP
jgi:hypothetical protein